jgi:hypothetical protein
MAGRWRRGVQGHRGDRDRRIGLFQWDMREKRGLLASTGMSTQDAVSAVAPSRPAIYVQRSSIMHNDFYK